MITHITDRERTQAALILALESARDEMAKRIEALTAELAQAYADSRQTVDDAAAVARENTALRAQPADAQEPVAWVGEVSEGSQLMLDQPTMWDAIPLYSAPPPAAVPLTDDEMMVAFCATHGLRQLVEAYVAGVAFAERHHGIAAAGERHDDGN